MDNNQGPPKQEVRDIRFEEPTFIDPLTGLFNQYYLYKFFPEEIQKAKLSNYPLTIFMIDLDGFKAVNDTYGHLCGDGVLKQLAVILKKFVRQTDMVIRYAGDEFALILPTADQNKAEILGNRLIAEVAKNIFKGKDNQDIRLTISIGFAIYPSDSEQIDTLIDLADKALYLSKQKGKNKISQAKEVTLETASYLVAMDSFPCPRFIDRKEELGRLKHIFDTIVVKSNPLQVAFISGEAGTGKTRLLNELDSYIRDRAVVINCRSSSVHTQDPYYLFANGISAYIDKIGMDSPGVLNLFSKIPPLELAELGRIIPCLSYPAKRPVNLEQEDKNARFLLFKSFLDVLIELNKTFAVLIHFDDIHWADKASLELLRYLSKQEQNKRIFIACTFTEDKYKQIMSKESDFNDLWEDIHFNSNFTHIKLVNFSLEDTSLMIETIFKGIGTEKGFCELIHDTTKGNPSFIEEILKSLVENAVIFYQDNRWQIKKGLSSQDIPFSMEEVLKKRLKNLDEETKEMIVQAAVIGDDFSADILKKIGNKDEGFMLELLNRVKKMRLVDELEPKGNFGFINKNVQNLLYNELNDEQRNLLHYKIGQAMSGKHKDNPYNVAGEIAFHFSQAPQQEKAAEYSTMFLEKTAQIFRPSETLEYLDKLTKELIAEEEKIAPASFLSDKMLKEAIRFIRSLGGAIKNFQLYPPGVMRANAAKEAYVILNEIWQESEQLNFAEVEKSLLINGKRLSPKEIEQANGEHLLALMLERNLKTVSFIKNLLQEGFEKFIQYLSQPYSEIIDKGGWNKILEKEKLKGIKIDEVHFIQVTGAVKEFAEKKKIEDVMLMEFLMGKAEQGNIDRKAIIQTMESEPKRFAQTVMDAASAAVKEGKADEETKAVSNSIEKISDEILGQEPEARSDYAKDLARVILELKPALRNKMIRSQFLEKESRQEQIADIIEITPDEVVVDMIIEEYKENQESLLVLKDYIDKILTNDSRKKEVLAKLATELSKINMASQDVAFINGQLNWEDLPLDKRINQIMRLPDKYYKSEIDKIRALLEGLDPKENSQDLENIFHHLLVKSGQLEPQTDKDLTKIMTDFVKGPFLDDKIDTQQMEGKLDGLLKRLNIEGDPKVFASILDIFREAIKEFTLKLQSAKSIILEIEKPATKKSCLLVQQFLSLLGQRLIWEESRNLEIYKLIVDFIRNISSGKFLDFFIYIIVNSPLQRRFVLKDIFSIVKNKFIDILINLATQRNIVWGDSFREYIIRKSIADLLREQDEAVLNIFKERLSQMKENITPSLIELVGYLKREDWIEVLRPYLDHKDPLIRRTAIIALGDIGTERSREIIREISKKEKDRNILILAKDQLRRLKARSR